MSRLDVLSLTALLAVSFVPAQETTPPSPAPAQADGEGTIQLQFPNNSVGDVLGIYELLTGKVVIRESSIFEGKPISLITSSPVTNEEAIALIESSLALNGYVLSQSTDGRSVRVALATTAQQASLIRDLPVSRTPESLPPGQTMASYFLQLKHLDPSDISMTIWGHLGLNSYGRLTPVASPRGILITESADNIRQIIRIVEMLDVDQNDASQTTKFYTLKYADATIVGQVLTSVFTTRQPLPTVTSDTLGDNFSRVPTRMVPPQRARVVSDDRLNRIMLVASPEDHEYAQQVIAEFDQPIKDQEPLERRLKYVFVDQVLPVLADILQDTGTGTSTTAAGEVIRSRRPPVASSDPATLAGRSRRGTTQREGAASAPAGYEDQLVAPEDTQPPLSVLVGKTRLVADVQSNKLIAFGPAEDLQKINSLLDRIDHRPPQVYLATIIGQLSLGDDFEIGIDFLREFKADGHGNFAAGLLPSSGVANVIPDIRTNTLANGIRAMQGLNVYGQIAEGVDVFVRALEATERFKVLSRPAIFAANNKKAVITSGRRIPVPTSSVTDLSNTSSVRTNIDFQDVVLKLEVIPLINSNREISLTIAQVNDTVVGQQMVADNSVPIIGTERLTTHVTVPNRSTIVLGGLISENEEKSNSGIPVLSRIPVLGHAFKSQRTTKTRSELIIFIQPVVVEDNREIDLTSRREDIRSEVGADAAEVFPQTPVLPEEEAPSPQDNPARQDSKQAAPSESPLKSKAKEAETPPATKRRTTRFKITR